MINAAKIVAYFLGVIVLGCLLAPPMWWAGQSVGGAFGWEFLTGQPFQRYFNRAVLVAAIALLWPMVRWLEIKGWAEFGLRRNPRALRHAFLGFAAAFALLAAVGLVGAWLGTYDLHRQIRWDKMWKIPGTMAAVALLEEWLFRGALLGLLLKTASPLRALAFVSALFSVVHILNPKEIAIDPVAWTSGFALLPYSFHQFAEPLLLLGGFTTLFAIGWVLGYCRLRTASLWLPIGLHAGWIAGNRAFNIVFKRQETLWPWFGPKLEIGLAPLVTVIVTGIVVAVVLRRERPA